ncbi:GTPase Era, mitochondrial [Trichinella nelsoni]|uniref:GTPase Era, mitochondrial n=1 Tax=Trichinella nelsoni TaxID=6336 RepID=A0A0V0S0U5_9BILA|nr:GTPase Era, mitochondrial [Trichinella nelsoni]
MRLLKYFINSRYFSTTASLFPNIINSGRAIELDPFLQREKITKTPEQFEGSRSLRVAVLGAPNAGKSMLTNALLGARVNAVSKKINTTQKTMTTVFIDDVSQLVFLDTPGIVTGKISKVHKLQSNLILDPENALQSAEYILVVCDVSDDYRSYRLNPRVQHLLCRYRHIPSLLILNKIDLIKNKSKLLEIVLKLSKGKVDKKRVKIIKSEMAVCKRSEIESAVKAYEQREKEHSINDLSNLELDVDPQLLERLVQMPAHKVDQIQLHRCFRHEKGWPYFDEVFMISALYGDGVDDVRNFLLNKTREAEWNYHSSVVADEDAVFLVKDIIRAKLLDFLPHEIPYSLKLEIIVWEQDAAGNLCIRLNVICENSRWLKIIVGKGGDQIKKIVEDASQDLRNLFMHEKDTHLVAVNKLSKSDSGADDMA